MGHKASGRHGIPRLLLAPDFFALGKTANLCPRMSNNMQAANPSPSCLKALYRAKGGVSCQEPQKMPKTSQINQNILTENGIKNLFKRHGSCRKWLHSAGCMADKSSSLVSSFGLVSKFGEFTSLLNTTTQ